MTTNLKKTIMRRVYYSYAIGFLSESMLWQGVVLGASIALFGRLTHVAAIARNLEASQLSNVPHYVLVTFEKALSHGEVLTVLVAVAMVGLSVSFMYRAFNVVMRMPVPRMA
jgi:hypothetical protein